MRKNRVVEQNRCYHLVGRLAHRAFFLDDEEKDRAVALMRRVEEFSGVVVPAYAFMSNHFHIFIYVPSAEEIGEGKILRRIRVLYHDASLSQVVATWNRLKTEEQELFKRARPMKKYVSRFGLVFDGTSAWCGCTRRNSETGRFESSLIRCVAPGGVE